MAHRIKHPTTEGAVYIAEAVISRIERSAVRRCGSYDILYEQFFCEEVYEFAYKLSAEEGKKFIDIASSLHPHMNEYNPPKTKEILQQIRESEF